MELIIKSLLRIISSPSSVLIPDANRIHLPWWMYIKHKGNVETLRWQTEPKCFGICCSSYWNECIIIHTWDIFNCVYFLADFIQPVLWFFFLWSHWTKLQENVIESKTQQLLFECNFSPLKISMLERNHTGHTWTILIFLF